MLWRRYRPGLAPTAQHLFPAGLCDLAAVGSLRVPLRFFRLTTQLALLAVVLLAPPALAGTMRHDVDFSRYSSLGADPLYQSVGLMEVAIFEEGQPAAGSGTLVAPDWVLTAAHVVQGGKAINFTVGGQTFTAS